MRLWSVPIGADAATVGGGICVVVLCVLGPPRAPAIAIATGGRVSVPRLIRECSEKQVAKMARVNAL